MSEFWPGEGEPPSIVADRRGKVGIITLNRPDKLNAWTPPMGTLYFDTLEQMAADPHVVVILVHGAGRGFCAGADMSGLGNIASSGGKTPGRDPRGYLHTLSIGKPVVAAIHGPCYGVGLQQALCCDLRLAAVDAKLALPYAKRGLIAEVGVSWLLSRLIGSAQTMELLLSARRVLADEALELGLVNRVMPDEHFLDQCLAYCQELAEGSPQAMRTIKQQVYRDAMTTLPEAYAFSEACLKQALSGADFAEGIAAFKEQRQADFPGLPPELAKLDPWPGAQ